jgi:hypothetical protein
MLSLIRDWRVVFPLAEGAFLVGFGIYNLWRYYHFNRSSQQSAASKFEGTWRQQTVGYIAIVLGVIIPLKNIFGF